MATVSSRLIWPTVRKLQAATARARARAAGPPAGGETRARRASSSISCWLSGSGMSFLRGCGYGGGGTPRGAHGAEPRAQADQHRGVDLAHAGFADAEHGADFLHRQFLEVVQGHELALAIGQFLDRLRQFALQLRSQADEVGVLFGRVGEIDAGLFAGKLRFEAAQLEAAQFAEELLELLQLHAQLGGDFFVAGGAAEGGVQAGMGLLDAARLAAQLARAPIEGAQAVENGAANAEFGVRGQGDVFAGVVLAHRVHQADDARLHQIVERDVARQAIMDAAGDQMHLGQLFQQAALDLRGLIRAGLIGLGRSHGFPFIARLPKTGLKPKAGSLPAIARLVWAGTARPAGADRSAPASRRAAREPAAPRSLRPSGAGPRRRGAGTNLASRSPRAPPAPKRG